MSNIFGFNFKSLKIDNGIYSASIYFHKLRLGKIQNKEGLYFMNWVGKITNEQKEVIYKTVKEYFNQYPKLIIKGGDNELNKENLLIELADDLVILDKIEKTFSTKKHRKENRAIIRLSFHDRKTEKHKPETIISCRNWNSSYSEKIKKLYSPKEFVVYNSVNDFIVYNSINDFKI